MFKRLFKSSKTHKLPGLEYKTLDWEFAQNESHEFTHIWQDKSSPARIFFQFIGSKPEIPTIKDVNQLRSLTREYLKQNHGSIIKVEIGKIQEVNVVEKILKFPMDPVGMIYLGSIVIPYQNCSYKLIVQCQEYEVFDK